MTAGTPKITECLRREGEKIAEKMVGNYMRGLKCGADNSDLAYKLGAGKLLELGSVKGKVLEVFTCVQCKWLHVELERRLRC